MATPYSTIGQPVTRGEGPDKVSGKSVYPADILLPGMLWGKVLRSPFPHARIVHIDTSRASRVPGVHAVLTGRDLPDRRVGRLLRDVPILAGDRVLFVGEKVAAVAAEDPDVAEEAILLIDVEYEEMQAVFDPLEAMTESAPVLHEGMPSYEGLPHPVSGIRNVFSHNTWTKGDTDQGFRESDLVFEHTFTTQLMHQAYIEPHACVVRVDDGGRVEVWVNNKAPFALREQLAAAWGLSEDRIRLNPCSIGGDFGGKGSFMDVPLCHYLALHSNRPVKMVMDYLQELMAGNPRHPAVISLKTGVKKDGRLWARQARVVFNSGAYGAFKPRVFLRGADHSGGAYSVPHVHIDSRMVYTNSVPCGHMRAPGKPQVVFAVESHMDMMAKEMGLDPYEFRLRNVLQEGDASPVGDKWLNIRAGDTLRRAAEASRWDSSKKKPFTGRGMAISDLPQGTGRSTARVEMNEQGKAALLMALWDTGTGAHTILRQVVAEELSISVEDVRIVVQDTDAVPFDSGSGGSRVTYTAGQAALGAAREVRNKLTAMAAELYGCPEDRIRLQSGQFFMDLDPPRSVAIQEVAAKGLAATERPIEGEMTYTSTSPEVTSFCAQVAEVEVDPETGQVKVNRIVTAHDVGTILNPVTHQGQIEGGVVQGLGYALMEEMKTEDGRVSTLSLGEYKIPTMMDIPQLTTVLLESPSGPAPFNGKGIGESSNIPVAAAVANAVHDAVGVRIMDLPITAEKVLSALKEKRRAEASPQASDRG